MHVHECGSGTPLILLHGFAVDHRMLLPLDPVIHAAGEWRRLYMDLPGHGRSPATGVVSAEDVVAAVTAQLRERVDDEPFAILGNSFGGMIARRIAHDFRHQVLGLAIIAGVFVANHSDRAQPERVVLSRDAAVLAELGDAADEYEGMAVVHARENAQAFMKYAFPGLSCADQTALERIAARYSLVTEPEDASPAPFTPPTLIITGRQDHVVGYEDAWARIEHYPRATFAAVDTAGHNTHLDKPTVVNVLVADWLDRVASHRS